MRNKIKKIFSYLFHHLASFLIGVAISVAFLYTTSNPTSSIEIQEQLTKIVAEQIQKTQRLDELPEIDVQVLKNAQVDLNPTNSVLIYGSALTASIKAKGRFFAVFEPGQVSVLDRLVGRPAFFVLKSLTYLATDIPDSFIAQSVKVRDIDSDGVGEIFVDLKTIFADSNANGMFILNRGSATEWEFLSLPSLTKVAAETLNGTYQPPAPLGIHSPYPIFGTAGVERDGPIPSFEQITEWGIFEFTQPATHNGEKVGFQNFRNGGGYSLTSHAVKDYPQLIVVGFATDGRAVLDSHYALVSAFKIEENKLVRDTLWNWGYPMVSEAPIDMSDVDFDSLRLGGVHAHVHGNTFYGYFDFQKLEKSIE